MQVIHQQPVSPRAINSRVSIDLETICLKCLEKDPAKRYESAQALGEDLRCFTAGDSIKARPAGLARRAFNWCSRVPLIAALTGHRIHEATVGQKRANWALLAAPLIVLVCFGLAGQYRQQMLPRHLKIASASPGGVYFEFSQAFAEDWRRHTHRTADVAATDGSKQNESLLISRQAHVALLQAGTVGAEPIDVVAPLYDDFIHVVIRRGRGITQLQELAGRSVALGRRESGMQLSARKLLNVVGVDAKMLGKTDVHFTQLETDFQLDAAIVTTGTANRDLRRILASGEFELLPVPNTNRLTHAIYHSVTIPRGFYLEAGENVQAVPSQDLPTVATTTFLAVHERASYRLVRELLQTLYEDSDLVEEFDLISRREAAEWRVFDFHPAAKQYFQQASDPLHK